MMEMLAQAILVIVIDNSMNENLREPTPAVDECATGLRECHLIFTENAQ